MKKETIIIIICTLLVILFVYAGVSKLLSFTEFKNEIKASPLLKEGAGILAWLVPAVELVIALLLTYIPTRIAGLYASAVLLLLFTMYIAGMLLSGEPLPCSCGGVIQQLTWQQHLVFNGVFLALSIVAITLSKATNKSFINKNISRK